MTSENFKNITVILVIGEIFRKYPQNLDSFT